MADRSPPPASGEHVVAYSLTESDWHHASRELLGGRLRRIAGWIGGLLFGVGAFVGAWREELSVIGVAALVGALASVFIWMRLRRLAAERVELAIRARSPAYPVGAQRLGVGADGLWTSTDSGVSVCSWTDVRETQFTRSFVAFVLGPDVVRIVPRRSFASPAVGEAFIAAVRRYTGARPSS